MGDKKKGTKRQNTYYKKEEVRITYHGERRARERLGIPRSAVKKNIERAMKYGVTWHDTYGPFRNYLDGLYGAYGTANNIRAYNHYVYVFMDNVLITVLNVPTKYIDAAEMSQRRKYNLMTEGEAHYVKGGKHHSTKRKPMGSSCPGLS